MDLRRFEELMDAYFDGEPAAELEPALRESAELRRLFVERAMLQSHLYHSYVHSRGAVVPRAIRRRPALAWAAVLVAMLLGAWLVFHEPRLETTERPLVRELSDGSRVHLSPHSAATIGTRRAALERGKAVFHVREHEKLFEIETPAGPVTVRAGEVAIEIAEEEESMNALMVIVVVAAGSAEVRIPGKAMVLTPGMNRVYAARQDEKKKDSEYTAHLKGQVTKVTEETITITRPATAKQDETHFTFRRSDVPLKNGPAEVGDRALVFYGSDGEAAHIQIVRPQEGEAKKKPAPDKKKAEPAPHATKGKITDVDGSVIVVNDDITINLKEVKFDGPKPKVGMIAVVYLGENGDVVAVKIHEPSPDGEKKKEKGEPRKDPPKKEAQAPAPALKGKIVDINKEKGTVTVANDERKLTIDLEGVKIDGELSIGAVAVVYSGPEGDPILIRTGFSDKKAPEKKKED